MAEQDPKQPKTGAREEQVVTPEGETVAKAAGDEAIEGAELSLEDEIAQLQEDVAQARDAALRAQADAQNVKRRAEQDVEKARKFALERFVSELLPVVDNLERALESASGDEEVVKPIAEGVQLTLKSFLDALGKNNIETVDPHGRAV